MKKIKLFLVTLLCLVGVMNASAQIIVKNIGETVVQSVTTGTGSLGNDDRTMCSWISNDSYDVVGNHLVVDYDGSANNAIEADDGNLRFGVVVALPKHVRVFAPLGWEIVGYSFQVKKSRISTAVYVDGERVYNETKTFSKNELSQNILSFELSTILVASTATFSDFKITLKKVGTPSDVINSSASTVDGGHWVWRQEVPTPGNSYKIVNGSSTEDSLIVIGQKNNETISQSEDADGVIITDKIEEGGEWLYGTDYTLTNYTDHVVGFYQSHVEGQGYNAGTQWRVSPLAIGDASGFAISNKSQVQIIANINLSRYYLKLSSTFTNLNMGDLGWNANPNENIFIWNFYSLDQYNCYISYKEAYNDFMNLETTPTEADSYYQTYLDLLDEIEDTPAQGYDETTREATYDRIRRMLELIATIKIDYPTPGGEGDPESDFKNPGAEEGTVNWEYTPTGTGTANVSATTPGHEGNNKFELENIKMTQVIENLIPGVYHVSVYWKADAGSEIDFAAEGVYDKQKVVLEGKGGNDWQKATLEVVVVTGKRLTVSAAAKTGTGKAYLDDFKLDYFSQNYYYDDAETKTRMYKGVFNAKQLTPRSNVDNKFIEKNVEKEFSCNTDNDFVATVDKDYPYADITNLAFYSKFKFDNSANPNGLVYAKPYAVTKEGTTDPATNVIVAEVGGAKCSSLVLQNGYPYSSKWNFTAADAKYDMTSFGTGLDDTDETVTFGTMMLPYSVESIPTDVKVYTASGISETGVLTLTEANSVEANKPYLVQYTGTSNPLFEAYSTNKGVAVEEIGKAHENGLLVGAYQLTEVSADGTCYLLQKQNGKLAFYRVATAGLNVGPFRAYLKVPAAMSQSKISIMIEDESTGINEIENANCDDAVYDLQGRRVENVSRPGVYVKNGKKFMVK